MIFYIMNRVSFILSILLIAICFSLTAQKVPRKLISVSGNRVKSAGYYLSWSVGEPVISTLSSGSFILTQGFQQPSLTGPLSPKPLPEDDFIDVYPNPVRNDLTVLFAIKKIHEYFIEVIGMDGRKLHVRNINFDESMFWEEKIDFSDFSQGLYLVHIFSHEGKIDRLFKIQKIKY